MVRGVDIKPLSDIRPSRGAVIVVFHSTITQLFSLAREGEFGDSYIILRELRYPGALFPHATILLTHMASNSMEMKDFAAAYEYGGYATTKLNYPGLRQSFLSMAGEKYTHELTRHTICVWEETYHFYC